MVKIIKTNNWTCDTEKVYPNQNSIQCISKKGKLLSAFDDETIRFSSNKEVKLDGKKLKGMSGVELE